ncbi:MAG: hypothetical protein GX434_03495 [Peptococcaceae bacterium]|nr:hypothetical protein [Peptococcaceae bacterium]
MITEVYPNIYQNIIPLPNFPLKTVNSYMVISDIRNVIIDTGFNTEEGRNALMEGIKELCSFMKYYPWKKTLCRHGAMTTVIMPQMT